MKLAITSTLCPNWTADTFAARSAELGFTGIEIPIGSSLLFSQSNLSSTLARAKVEITCLSVSSMFVQNARQDVATAMAYREAIDLAQSLNCSLVKVPDTQVKAGQSRAVVGGRLADWLLPLGDYAAQRGVTLVIENALSFRRARDIWAVIEHANHPSIGACWNILSAASAGEVPGISVPMLNSRIRYVRLADARIDAGSSTPCPIGQGSVNISRLIQKLKGVGYDAFITFSAGGSASTGDADPALAIGADLAALKAILAPPVLEKPAVEKPAKPVAAVKK